jgi:DNA (cytosine-5)-methyltransferase 1
MKVIDLFCGCGGFSLGMKNAGYTIIAAYDNWEPAINVYKENFKHPIYNIDLQNLSNNEIESMKALKPEIIIGGPPCQDYSSAGNRDENGGRADLTITFAKIVDEIKPKYFIMENVNDIKNYSTLDSAKKIFKANNYGLTEVVLDASYYGVPQARKRYFLIGELNGKNNDLEEILNSNKSSKKMTVREYLGNDLGVEAYYRHPRSYNRRGIFSIDEPSPTIRGVNRPVPPTYKKHPGDRCNNLEGIRALTTIERSYIQTFPSSFSFHGTKTNLEQIIGNAVPVNLAKHVGECLLRYINNKNNESK